MITDRKIGDWESPVSGEADRPNRSATDMKAIFDSNSNELKTALNGVIDDIGAGAAALAFTQAASRANIESGDSLATILGKLAKFYADAQTAVNTIAVDEETHNRYLSADGTYTVPEAGEAANGLPSGGTDGQLLVKNGETDFEAEWKTAGASDFGAVPSSEKGAANGVAELDENSKLDAAQASAAMVNAPATLQIGKFNIVSTATAYGMPDANIGDEFEVYGEGDTVVTFNAADTGIIRTSSGAHTSGTVTTVGTNPVVSFKKIYTDTWLAKGDIS